VDPTPPVYRETQDLYEVYFTYGFFLFVGGALLVVLVLYSTSPSLRSGNWDVDLSALLLVATPVLVSVGALRKIWRARFLKTRPVEVFRDHVEFPTRWWESRRTTQVNWKNVQSVATDYDARESRRRFFWTIWLVLKDNSVKDRLYLVEPAEDRKVASTMSELARYAPVVELRTALQLAGKRIAHRFTILVARGIAIVSLPVSILPVAGLYFLGQVNGGSPLFFAAAIVTVADLALPLWWWSSEQKQLQSSLTLARG